MKNININDFLQTAIHQNVKDIVFRGETDDFLLYDLPNSLAELGHAQDVNLTLV